MFMCRDSFDLDNNILVCGLSAVGESGAKVIDLSTQKVIKHLDHQFEVKVPVEDVKITKSFIITSTYKDHYNDHYELYIWCKKSFKLLRNVKSDANFILHCNGIQATEFQDNLYLLSGFDTTWIQRFKCENLFSDIGKELDPDVLDFHPDELSYGPKELLDKNQLFSQYQNYSDCAKTFIYNILTDNGMDVEFALRYSDNGDGEDDIDSEYDMDSALVAFSAPHIAFAPQDISSETFTNHVQVFNTNSGEEIWAIPIEEGESRIEELLLHENILIVTLVRQTAEFGVEYQIFNISPEQTSPAKNVFFRSSIKQHGRIRANNYMIVEEDNEDNLIFFDFFNCDRESDHS